MSVNAVVPHFRLNDDTRPAALELLAEFKAELIRQDQQRAEWAQSRRIRRALAKHGRGYRHVGGSYLVRMVSPIGAARFPDLNSLEMFARSLDGEAR
jgi:hypothetical protein